MYRNLMFLFIISISIIVIASCKKDDDNDQIADHDVPETTKVISDKDWSELVEETDTTDYTFVFKQNPGVDEGDILVSSIDGGYLRRITNIKTEGEYIVIETEFASITDAIRNAEIDYSQPLVVDQDALKTAFLEQGVTINEEMLKNSDNTNLSFNIDFVLYDADGNPNTTGDQIKMEGHFGNSTEFSANVNIQDFVLQELSFVYDIHKEKSLNVSCGIAAINLEKEQRIARIPFHDIVIPAGIPITIQPVLELYAGVGFELNSQLQMGMIETVDYTTTVSYENGEWSTSKTVDESFDYMPPTLTAGVEATAYIKPKLLFKIYRVLSPKVEANLYGQLSAEARAIDWELNEGFSAGVGVEMRIWNHTLFDFTANVIDLKYAIAQGTIGEGNAPVVDFSGLPLTGDAPLTVQFTDLSTNNPTSWLWDFGDGNSSTQQNPSHLYSQPGTYTVILSGTNNNGTDSKVKSNYIQVNGTGSSPVADFSATPLSGQAPLTVSFTDLSTNNPTSWNWDFGDGGTSSQQNPTHTYTNEGNYTVSITATNDNGFDVETKFDYINISNSGNDCSGLRTTNGTYSETDNLIEALQGEFGTTYTIGDWNHLKAIANIDEWISCMELEEDVSFMLTRNGSYTYSGNRQYFVRYSTDGVGSGWLIHDQIGNLYLGSWYGLNYKILCVKNN